MQNVVGISEQHYEWPSMTNRIVLFVGVVSIVAASFLDALGDWRYKIDFYSKYIYFGWGTHCQWVGGESSLEGK